MGYLYMWLNTPEHKTHILLVSLYTIEVGFPIISFIAKRGVDGNEEFYLCYGKE